MLQQETTLHTENNIQNKKHKNALGLIFIMVLILQRDDRGARLTLRIHSMQLKITTTIVILNKLVEVDSLFSQPLV
jgi:hypothetical protein